MTAPLPGAKRPSWRWYVAVLRLVLARLWEKTGLRSASRFCAAIALFAGAALMTSIATRAALPAEARVHMALGPIVVQLILFAVSLLVSWALTPKPKPPEQAVATAPQVEDGQGMDIICGTVWVEDESVLAFKQVGTKKIKAKGGKKG